MASQRITSRNGQTIGYIKDHGQGQIAENANGSTIGRYAPENDCTYDSRNCVIGRGNQLMRLFN